MAAPSAGDRRTPGRVLVCALAAAHLACGAGWRRHDLEEALVVSPRQQAQVWSGGTAQRWHALRLTDDSVSGVPYWQPIACDSCRAAVPRAAVDSIRFGNPAAGFWKSVGLVLLVPLVACAVTNCASIED